MSIDIFPTTAEHIIAVTDAVTTREDGCDLNYVSQFIDVPIVNTQNALEMAMQLQLVDQEPPQTNPYFPHKPFASYLVTAKDAQKAAVLRLVLENYEPYHIFKHRLAVTNSVTRAAEQVKLMFNLTPHRDEIKDTLISLGTFAQSLVTEGAGSFRVTDYNNPNTSFLLVVAEVAADRGIAEAIVRSKLGDENAAWINQQEVLAPLVTAYQRLGSANDSRTCVVNAGNAIESFLVQLAAHMGIGLEGATGINAKADRLGPQLNTKHRNIIKYLGHIRNAADHGIDPDIGSSWEISPSSAIEYVHISISAIKSIVNLINNNRYII